MNPKDIVQVKSGIPPIIYLQWFGDEKDPQPDPDWPVVVSEVSWSLERIFDADIEYKANQPIRFDSAFEEDVQCEAQRPREMIYSLRAQLEAERQLKAEAVELLRRYARFAPKGSIVGTLDLDARAFLAKVDAP